MKHNIVGHCFRPQSNNNKVYMCCIRKTHVAVNPFEQEDRWLVIAKWGRRGNKMSNQVKGEFKSEQEAVREQESCWLERVKEGYIDIESPDYFAHMAAQGGSPLLMADSIIRENLEYEEAPPDVGIKEVQPNAEQRPAKAAKTVKEEEVMVCVDNSGISDHFDVGIEYVVDGNHSNDKMIYAYDKIGEKGEYFRERFVTVKKFEVTIMKSRIKEFESSGKVEFMKFKVGEEISIKFSEEREFPLEHRKHFTGLSR